MILHWVKLLIWYIIYMYNSFNYIQITSFLYSELTSAVQLLLMCLHFCFPRRTLFPPDQPALTREMLSTADVSPDTRPFMLDIAEIDRLCHVYKDICDRHPGLIDYNYRSAENALDWRRAKLPLNI